MSAFGTKRTCQVALHMSAFGGKADIDDLAPGGGIKKIYAIKTASGGLIDLC